MPVLKRAATLLLIAAVHARAQSARAAVSVAAGAETNALGVASRAITVTPTASFVVDPRLVFDLQGAATRYDDHQSSFGGGAAAAARLQLGRFAAATLNADASGTGTSFGFSYSSAGLLPALELTAGRVTAYGGVHAAYASTRTSTVTAANPGPGGLFGGPTFTPPPTTSVSSSSRTGRTALIGVNARFTTSDGGTVVVGARDEQGTVGSVAVADRTALLTMVDGRLSIGASIGLHSDAGVQSTIGSGSVSLAVTPAASIELSAGAYPTNQLIGTSAGHYLTLGMSIRTGRMRTTPAPKPVVEGIAPPAAGFTRLALHDDKATRVEIAGDFTNWKLIAARRAGDGVWYVDLHIPPGQYRYAFRVDGAAWKVPDGVAVVDDGFGGQSAWLTVSDAPKH